MSTSRDHTEIDGESKTSAGLFELDTTAGSILHQLFDRLDRTGIGDASGRFIVYLVSVALTYGALLIAASRGPLWITQPDALHKVPFIEDLNAAFMFLLCFPYLVVLTVTDQRVLGRALKAVQAEDVVKIAKKAQSSLAARWTTIFFFANLFGQIFGAMVGAVVAYFNYVAFVPAEMGHWMGEAGKLSAMGYIMVYSLFLFFAVVVVYVVRNFTISLLLKDIVAHAQVHLLPLHPDKAGGLLPVGRLGLRN